jgi:5-methylcytosine-specific restriction endonuclease McrA
MPKIKRELTQDEIDERKKRKRESAKAYRESHKNEAKEYMQKYRQENSERIKSQRDKHRADNREIINKRQREYLERNRDEINRKKREVCAPRYKDYVSRKAHERYLENPEKHIERARKYQREHHDLVRAYRIAYYERNRTRLIDYSREYRDSHREHYSEYNSQYKRQNSEYVRLYNIAYRAAHRAEDLEYKRRYHAEHRHEERERDRRYYQAHPEKKRAKENNRKARIYGNGGRYTDREWIELCAAYDNRCLCCGEKTKLTVDHVVPVSKGGRNSIDNIQPLCQSCNSKKGRQVIDYRKLVVVM